jgi:hypothetical protein
MILCWRRQWGGGEKEREKEEVENREILSCLEGKCPVEKCSDFVNVERISLEKRESL